MREQNFFSFLSSITLKDDPLAKVIQWDNRQQLFFIISKPRKMKGRSRKVYSLSSTCSASSSSSISKKLTFIVRCFSKKLTFNKRLHHTPHIQFSLWNLLALQKLLHQTRALIIIFCLFPSQATHKIQSNACQPIRAKTGSWKRKWHKRKVEFMHNVGDMRAQKSS